MEKIEGEPSRGAGLPGPVLLNLQGTINQKAANGDVVPVFHVAPETLAAIEQTLAAGCEPHGQFLPAEPPKKSPGGKRKPSRTKMYGLLLLATGACLVSGLCYGHHCQTHENHKNSEARNFSCQTKVGRRRSVPDGPVDGKSEKQKLLAEGHQTSGETRPECVVRAECCVNRQPNGRCRTTEQPCRLFVGTDDVRAMMAEVRAGVVGRAMGPPNEKVEILKPETLKSEVLAASASGANKNIRTVGRFQYGAGFKDVWLGGEHFDLRGRAKARFCLQYLVSKQAFDPDSARHLEKEIDPFVRKKCQLPPPSEIRIQHYFNDRSGKLSRLRSELVKAAGRNGRFYLQVV